jgi:hypothetical protein
VRRPKCHSSQLSRPWPVWSALKRLGACELAPWRGRLAGFEASTALPATGKTEEARKPIRLASARAGSVPYRTVCSVQTHQSGSPALCSGLCDTADIAAGVEVSTDRPTPDYPRCIFFSPFVLSGPLDQSRHAILFCTRTRPGPTSWLPCIATGSLLCTAHCYRLHQVGVYPALHARGSGPNHDGRRSFPIPRPPVC